MQRVIEPKMIQFIDAKLAGNGLAQDAIAKKDARALFVCVLEVCVGIRESGGNNKGPMVELIQETVGRAEREAWCMALIQTALAYVEHKLGVKSPIAVSEHCLTVWNSTPKKQRVKLVPARGAIIIWRKGSTTSGHTGIVLEYGHKAGKMSCIEGNTESGINKDGTINRDGGGIYRTERSSKANGSMKVVGFLKPF